MSIERTPVAKLAASREVLASLVGREGTNNQDIIDALTVINTGTEDAALQPEKMFDVREAVLQLTTSGLQPEVSSRLSTSLATLQEKVNDRFWRLNNKESIIVSHFAIALGLSLSIPSATGLIYTMFDTYHNLQTQNIQDLQLDAPLGVFLMLIGGMGSYFVATGINQVRNSRSSTKFIERYHR